MSLVFYVFSYTVLDSYSCVFVCPEVVCPSFTIAVTRFVFVSVIVIIIAIVEATVSRRNEYKRI